VCFSSVVVMFCSGVAVPVSLWSAPFHLQATMVSSELLQTALGCVHIDASTSPCVYANAPLDCDSCDDKEDVI